MTAPEQFIATGTIADIRRLVSDARAGGLRVGCVPTMGALHAGHVSLFEECRRRADFVVATIFVNPTQFAPHEDLDRYPRPLENDLRAARQAGVHVVFTPEAAGMYPTGFATSVAVSGLSRVLEGKIRPDHFSGVATVVLKLLNIVQPDLAVFGAKDFQQQAIIRRMVQDLNVCVEVVTAPTVRDPDGVALSSRNAYLSARERKSARALSQSLEWALRRLATGESDLPAIAAGMWDILKAAPLVDPDYAVIVDPDTLTPLDIPQSRMQALVAARVGTTRLIDNLELTWLPNASGQPSETEITAPPSP